MVVCSFSWANDKRFAQFYLFFIPPHPPQLCQILCLKNYYYEKSKEEAEYLRPVWDGLISTWSIRISNASSSEIASEPTTFGSEAIKLGLFLLFSRVPWGRRRCCRLLLRPRSRAARLLFLSVLSTEQLRSWQSECALLLF
jgi:hypothetical protein